MSKREDKLKRLEQKKPGNDMVVIANGAQFIEALQGKIEELRKALAVDIEVNLDDLITEMKYIENISPAVKSLQDTLNSLSIPEVITLTGISSLEKLLSDHLKAIKQIPELKLPEANIKVDVQQIGQEHVKEITNKVDELIQSIEKNAVVKQQAPTDYIPIRRVRNIGNRLIFDDGIWGGGGSGGGSSVQESLITGDAIKVVSSIHPNSFTLFEDHTSAQTNNPLKDAPGTDSAIYITDIIFSNGATAGSIKLIEDESGTPTQITQTIYMAINGGAVMNFLTPKRLTTNKSLGFTSNTLTTYSIEIHGYIAS